MAMASVTMPIPMMMMMATDDAEDAFPLNPFDWTDTDNDGVGDNTDAFGLDENQQSLLVAEAVSKVLDETLRQCIAAATVDLSRAASTD